MQNPAFQQQVMGGGAPGGQNPFGSSTALADLFNPNMMQAMAQLEQSLGQMGGQTNGGQSFNSLFGNFLSGPSPADPEVRYRAQLATLRSMGFEDTQASIRALDRTGGNVDQAVDILILERTNVRGSSSADSSSK